MRKIQSFVRRSGRLTLSQQSALDNLQQQFIIKKPYSFADIWQQQKAIILEIGFGNGDSLVQMAEQNLSNNYIGIEVYEAGIGRIINNANNLNLSNLKIINDDAFEVLRQMPNNYLSGFQLFFPDPWHKKKHHKRRLINSEFLELLSSKLQLNSFVHMATDWQDYAEQMLKILENNEKFINKNGKNNYADKANRPTTKFERRGIKLGHNVWDLIFEINK